MKMTLEILLIIIAVVIFVYLAFHSAQILLSPVTQQNLSNSVCIKEKCFQVELAKTPAERERGLMLRAQLDEDKGMFFVFEREGIYPFWMKNTLIPLDIIWIKENPSAGSGQVVFISQNVQPCKTLICPNITPGSKAKYVLELNAGVSESIGLKVGDLVKISPGL